MALLTDLRSGTVLARASGYNKQMKHGDNVLTRIQYCHETPEHVQQLKEAVALNTIRPLIERAVDRAGIDPGRIACFAVAGNTTMLHLLAGVDPTSMGIAPFTPTFIEERRMTASEFGWTDNGISDVPVHLLPGYSAYVGADLAAGVFATGMAYDEKVVLLVDVGTNGAPDIYQQPREALDFVYSQKFGDHWKFKFRARNLLDSEVELTQGDKTRRSFNVGREYTAAIEWSF